MHDAEVIERFVEAANLTSLRIAFSELCSGAGEIESIEILLHGSYGDFCAFCTAKMKTRAAEDALLRQYGFQRLGSRVFLPRALARQFERRALARVA
jgi:hypothetical protein